MDAWIGLTINDEKIKDIFQRIEAARNELMQCIIELERLGITVSIGKEPSATPDDYSREG